MEESTRRFDNLHCHSATEFLSRSTETAYLEDHLCWWLDGQCDKCQHLSSSVLENCITKLKRSVAYKVTGLI